MESDNNSLKTVTGCGKWFKGCAVVSILLIILLVGLVAYFMRMPGSEDMLKCRQNMDTIGQALRRYADVNGKYPANLDKLKKEYLKDPSVLRCPLDKSGNGEPSYIYHRPKMNSKGSFRMLQCNRHRFRRDMPVNRLILLKNGTFEAPSFKETYRDVDKETAKHK